MIIRAIILILSVLFVTSCGEFDVSHQTQKKSLSESPPLTPEPPPINSDNPTPPSSDEKSQVKVCFLKTSKGQTCFDVHDIDNVNQAENKYDYIDPFNNSSFPSGLDKWQYRRPVNLLFSSQHLSTAPLAENFLRYEVLNSNDNRGNYGFFSPVVLEKIQQMRDHFEKPITINSGYRSPAYNATLPGAARLSRHTYGDGIDFKISGVSFSEISQVCKNMGASYFQIYSSHIHCDWRNTPLNETVYGEDTRSAVSTQSFNDVTEALETELRIRAEIPISPSARKLLNKKPIQLSVEHLHLEDGNGVIYSWQVSQNGKVLRTSSAASPVFNLKTGTYKVSVKIGGSLGQWTQLNVE